MTTIIDKESLTLFQDMVTDFVASQYPFEGRLPRLEGQGPRYDEQAWRAYGEMGWLAVALDEPAGGFDADPALVGALMHGVGQGLLLEPIFASAILSVRLLRLLGWTGDSCLSSVDVASGRAILTLAHLEDTDVSPWADADASFANGRLAGRKIAVLHGDCATHLLVTAANKSGDLVVLLLRADAPGVMRESYRLLDGRMAATFSFDTAHCLEIGSGSLARTALTRAIDEGVTALCSEALGAIRRLTALTQAYLGERRQFGRPIGANQVLQHRMVECLIQEAEVAAVISVAQQSLRTGDETARMRSVSGAMAVTAAAGRHIASEAVQMHGGIGMTHEYAVSHYLKRLRVIELLLGQRRHHVRRFSDYAG